MPIDKSKITKEMIEKAEQCKTSDDLIALAKASGVTLTKEEAEAYLAELDNIELDEKALDNVAGGYSCGKHKYCVAVGALPGLHQGRH